VAVEPSGRYLASPSQELAIGGYRNSTGLHIFGQFLPVSSTFVLTKLAKGGKCLG
jgi:hypothetical protein